MILKISEKLNVNGWRRQILVDFDNKTIKTGPFQFHGGDIGKVYIRVWRRNKGNELSKSVFCFIDKCGNIYKPSGWAKPAKGIRATLDNPVYNSAGLYR